MASFLDLAYRLNTLKCNLYKYNFIFIKDSVTYGLRASLVDRKF